MEKYGITAPPKVMWGVDDEIRALIKEAARLAEENAPDLKDKAGKAAEQVREMIFKEENILLPMLTEILTEDEWREASRAKAEIGFIKRCPRLEKGGKSEAPPAPQSIPGVISLPSGSFSVDELTHLLNTLPLDITFVDKDDKVKYFLRARSAFSPRYGNNRAQRVQLPPPASVHIVEKIVADLRSGKKEHEDFWIKTKDAYILYATLPCATKGGISGRAGNHSKYQTYSGNQRRKAAFIRLTAATFYRNHFSLAHFGRAVLLFNFMVFCRLT